MDNIQISYFAGFFDGEGTIFLDKNYGLACAITSTDKWITELFCSNFNGTITFNHARTRQRPCYQWSLKALNAMNFLKVICPFLTLKKAEAKIAIDFQSKKEIKKNNGHFTSKYYAMSPEEKQERERIRLLLKALKRQHDIILYQVKPVVRKEM